MGCIITILIMLGSRIALLFWWLADPQRFNIAFKNGALLENFVIPVWAWTLLGGIVLPWTTLAYIFVFPGGIVGYEWIVVGLALVIDLAGYGGGYHHRNRIRSYRRS